MKGACLVLGANGFIGSYLVDGLIAAGYTVRAFDRFDSSEPKYLPSDRVERFAGDIYDRPTLRKSLEGIEYVFHCFSATTPHSSDDDPYTDIEKNLKPSIVIFRECVDVGVKKVVYISSGGAVYGEAAEQKTKQEAAGEDDAPLPVSPYGIIKLSVEGYLAYFKRKFGLDYIVYRPSNPYGPRQMFHNRQGVIPAFISRIKNHEPLHVYGDGSASRDYIYIRDLTDMIVGSFAKRNTWPVYNLGSGRQTTVNEIIGQLRELMDEDVTVEWLKEPKVFVRSASISIERFEREFGLGPLTDMRQGLELTLRT